MMYSDNYDPHKKWADQHPGWHELVLRIDKNDDDSTDMPDEVIKWLEENIDHPRRHTIWCRTSLFEFCIKFRYQRDFTLTSLRWL